MEPTNKETTDHAYLNYLRSVLTDKHSVVKSSRAGFTVATTGLSMRFTPDMGFPLLTTKQLYTRGIFTELVWFLKGPAEDGEMHIDYLVQNKCNFWTANVFEKYLKDTGNPLYHYKNSEQWKKALEMFSTYLQEDPDFLKRNGKMGRVYGAQWRAWRNPNGPSIDQLADAMEAVKERSDSRRLIVETWRPDEIKDMALPPCHKNFQFFVMEDRLDMTVYQRLLKSASIMKVIVQILLKGEPLVKEKTPC